VAMVEDDRGNLLAIRGPEPSKGPVKAKLVLVKERVKRCGKRKLAFGGQVYDKGARRKGMGKKKPWWVFLGGRAAAGVGEKKKSNGGLGPKRQQRDKGCSFV